ncbi:MAG: hypothetical protein H0V82_06960 [Candidatus Protochlamydia sp.]|nr:hypothetical protein [Candidatus Protochlamydia sp.]
MEHRFIRDVNIITLSLAISACLIVWCLYSLSVGLSIFMGAMWGCLNFYFLKKLFEEYLKGADRDFLQCFAWLGIKFPLLYLSGFALLKLNFFSSLGLAGGFSLIFIAIFLLGITRLVKKQDRGFS